MPFKD